MERERVREESRWERMGTICAAVASTVPSDSPRQWKPSDFYRMAGESEHAVQHKQTVRELRGIFSAWAMTHNATLKKKARPN